ncbi:MAG: tetratricopeptide repeat protein [Acidobacteria bacterium]|nr:MAG: tetratricopeptide repeat protein [Acidobacteriota bacterium]
MSLLLGVLPVLEVLDYNRRMQSRASFSLSLAMLALIAGCSRSAGPSGDTSATSPSVILISIDTLRADHLSAYGYQKLQTRNLDRLAAQGVLFEQAISPVPLTLPAHASLLTGTLPVFHGVRDNTGFILSEKHRTVAQALGSHGFRTGAFVGAFVLDSRFGLDHGFDYYYDNFDSETLETARLQVSERRAEDVLSEARRWIGQASGQKFFAFIHLFDPHAPYAAPAGHQAADRLAYDAEVSYVDTELGRFFSFLEERRLWNDSLIILTADHGEGLGEHGEQSHGLFLYDATLHVPLIVKLPGETHRGRRVSDQVRLIDVTPTVLDILGVPALEKIQGVSLKAAINGGELPELAAYSETQLPFLNYGWSGLDAYRAKGEKLIDAPRPELYDLVRDPRETANLFTKNRTRAGQLRQIKQRIAAQATNRSADSARQTRVDRQTIQRLRSLGYLAGGNPPAPEIGPNLTLADPKDKIRFFNLISDAQLASQEGRVEESVALLRRVLSADQNVFFAHSVQALNYLELKRPDAALPHLRAAVRLRPDDPGAHFYLAMALSQLGKADQAIAEFELARKLDPENEAALNNLATLYLGNRQLDEAVTLLKEIIGRHPEDVAALVNLGLAQLLQKQPAQAIANLERALQVNPNVPEAHNNLGLSYLELGQTDRAIVHFERALAIRPEYVNARDNLARARGR